MKINTINKIEYTNIQSQNKQKISTGWVTVNEDVIETWELSFTHFFFHSAKRLKCSNQSSSENNSINTVR